MTLLWIPLLLFIAAPLAWVVGRVRPSLARWTAAAALVLDGLLVAGIWRLPVQQGPWIQEVFLPWIPAFGSHIHLAVDGISLALLALTVFLGLSAVISSWRTLERAGLWYAMLLWLLAAIAAVFLAIDLFLFYVAWELMLIPAYFLIAFWGSGPCLRAANTFFLFTQAGGLVLLAAVAALYAAYGTFDYRELLSASISPTAAVWLMAGFVIAFFIKIPIFPFHTWMPEAYAEAPAPVSLLLAGLLAKTGAYGLIRFVLPIFPQAAASFAPFAWGLGASSILYGAALACAQTDLKRLIAYSSLSHMGFVLIGIFSGSAIALQGALVIMIAHGISISGLFLVANDLKTRDLTQMGGLWTHLGGVGLFFAVATLGLPGLGNFVGEFLVLLGIFSVSVPTAAVAALGLTASAVYALRMVQKVFFGNPGKGLPAADLPLEMLCLFAVMMAMLLLLGLFPEPLFNLFSLAVRGI